jgi:hypothetical protein
MDDHSQLIIGEDQSRKNTIINNNDYHDNDEVANIYEQLDTQ